MVPIRKEIARAAEKQADEWIMRAVGMGPTRSSGGGLKGLLPIQTDAGGSTCLDEEIREIVDNGTTRAAILAAPLGSGKTMATCQLPQVLPDYPSLWLPCRDTNFFATDPDSAILDLIGQYLGRVCTFRIWGPGAGIRYVVLDGVDEGISIHGAGFLRWLQTLLQRMGPSQDQPLLLLSGRDVALGESIIDPPILETLRLYNQGRNPVWLGLRAWRDDEMRPFLVDQLATDCDSRARAERAVARIAQGVLSSPLLFGLAYRALSGDLARGEDAGAQVYRSQWELSEYAIRCVIHDNAVKTFGSSPIPDTECWSSARRVALRIAVLGASANGLKVAQLQANEMNAAGLQEIDARFLDPKDRLRLGALLLSRHRDGYSLFHEQILIHLAAEELACLASEGYRQRLYADEHPFDRYAHQAGVPELAGLLRLLQRAGESAYSALQPDAPLGEVIRYWLRHRREPDLAALHDPGAYARYVADDVSATLLRSVQQASQGVFGAAQCHEAVAVRDRVLLSSALSLGIAGASQDVVRPTTIEDLEQDSVDLVRELVGDLGFQRQQNRIIRVRVLVPSAPEPNTTVGSFVPVLIEESDPGTTIWELLVELRQELGRVPGLRHHLWCRVIINDDDLGPCPADATLRALGVVDDCTLTLIPRVRLVLPGAATVLGGGPDPGAGGPSSPQGLIKEEVMPDEMDFIWIPSGLYPCLRKRADGHQEVRRERIRDLLFLADRLVSYTEVCAWHDEASRPSAGLERASAAVGVSREDAQSYVDWLDGQRLLGRPGMVRLQLPRSHWLQIAALGPSLDNPGEDGTGPLGHQSMIGRLWQWTGGGDGDGFEALAFGGSDRLGDNPKSVQQTLLRRYPDLCRRLSAGARDEWVGIRLALVICVSALVGDRSSEMEEEA